MSSAARKKKVEEYTLNFFEFGDHRISVHGLPRYAWLPCRASLSHGGASPRSVTSTALWVKAYIEGP